MAKKKPDTTPEAEPAIELTQAEARAVVLQFMGKISTAEARKALGCGDVNTYLAKVEAWLQSA